jgi:hypothetical protein
MNKSQLLAQVRALVADVTRARFEGGAYAKMMRAHGYADGYMRALLDAGLVDRAEMLKVVGSRAQRRRERRARGRARGVIRQRART